jgi:hypothetical protein
MLQFPPLLDNVLPTQGNMFCYLRKAPQKESYRLVSSLLPRLTRRLSFCVRVPGAKNCQSSRLSTHLKLATCKFTVKSRSLPSISSIPKDTSDEETCCSVPTHRVVSPCIEEEWKNSLVDAVFHLFNCDSASSLDGFIFSGKPAVSNHNLLVRKTP